MDLSERERITILMMRGYSDRIRLYCEVNNYLMVRFLIEILSSVERTVKRFEDTAKPRIFLKPVDLSLQQMMR